MKCPRTIIAAAATLLIIGGCATQPQKVNSGPAVPSEPVVSLVALGDHEAEAPMSFRLGAGDALGRSIFSNYVAYVRANRLDGARYATGE